MSESDHRSGELAELLSELFDESVRLESLNEQELGGAQIAIVNMEYWRDPDRGPARHVSQTAAVLNDPELDLPEFTLQPPMKRPLVV